MADDSRGLLSAEGTRWRNWTDRPWYQFVSSLRHPCPVCLRLHGRVSPDRWPIPMHPHCECDQLEVPAGGAAPIEARPLRELVRMLDADGRAEVLGVENLELLGRDLVTYPDLFDEWGDPLPFDRVVRSAGLTLEQLLGAGIPEASARRVLGL